MAIAFIKKIDTNRQIGCWEISESDSQSFKNTSDKSILSFIAHSDPTEKRKREVIAVRLLLQQMTSSNETISYYPDGSPFLESHNFHLSISHSKDFAALYLSKYDRVGVDIQIIKSSVLKGLDFYINETEKRWVDISDKIQLNLIWSAKESIFKFYGDAHLDFKQNIKINPFETEQFGTLVAYIENTNQLLQVQVAYEIMENYVLTWTLT
tara:strand:- start:227 stop:856 length:630 start_codon:yes stop_codon:yes gene_type:complete